MAASRRRGAVVEHRLVPGQAEEIEQGPHLAVEIRDHPFVADAVDLERQQGLGPRPGVEHRIVGQRRLAADR